MKLILTLLILINTTGAFAIEMVALGDTGHDNKEQRQVADAMIKHCKQETCDAGILAGDNVYSEGVLSEIDPVMERVFDKYYNALDIPFLVTLGNHDYGKRANKWKRGEYQMLHAKKNPNFYFPSFWYNFETPEAVITVIDTSRIFWKKDREIQAAFVAEAYKSAKEQKKWFMVVGHHPYLSNGEHGNAGKYERVSFPYFISGSEIKKFVEKNICGKADFYLSGHDHNMQIFDGNITKCNTQFVVSGAGSSTTALEKRNESVFQAEAIGFMKLSIKKESFRIRAFDSEAKVLFEKTYKH